MQDSPTNSKSSPYRLRQAWRTVWIVETLVKKKWQTIKAFGAKNEATKYLEHLHLNFVQTGQTIKARTNSEVDSRHKKSGAAKNQNLTQPMRPLKFKDIFETHTNTETGEIRWRIKHSGVRGVPTTALNTQRIVAALRGTDVKVREWSSASPANASAYHLSADFDDGGISGMTGNYFYGPRGIWVSGRQAISRVCFLLGIHDSLVGDP